MLRLLLFGVAVLAFGVDASAGPRIRPRLRNYPAATNSRCSPNSSWGSSQHEFGDGFRYTQPLFESPQSQVYQSFTEGPRSPTQRSRAGRYRPPWGRFESGSNAAGYYHYP